MSDMEYCDKGRRLECRTPGGFAHSYWTYTDCCVKFCKKVKKCKDVSSKEKKEADAARAEVPYHQLILWKEE